MARVAIEVDRPKLEGSLIRVESAGPVANRVLLYERVCQEYNGNNPPSQITPSIVSSRLKQWGTNVQTPKHRGRPKKVLV